MYYLAADCDGGDSERRKWVTTALGTVLDTSKS